MSITHTYQSATPNNPAHEISSDRWNESHALTGALSDLDGLTFAQGDILYYNGTNLVSLGPGTSGKFLKTQGAAANPIWDTVAAGLSGSGTTGQLSKWTGATALGDAAIIPPATNILTLTNAAAATLALNITSAKTLTLTAADDYTLTVPATGTAALLATANVFTTQQMVDGTSDQIQLRIQAHSTQTADLLTWENSAGLVLGKLDSQGRIYSYGASGITTNFFVGTSGTSITTGDENMGIGFPSLYAITSGRFNVAIGNTAGRFNQTGQSNVYIGNNSGRGVSTKSHTENVFIGESSGYAIQTGGFNTFIGAYSGYNNSTGASGIRIGYFAGWKQTTLSNLLIIDNVARASAAEEITNSIFYGVMAATPGAQTLRLNAVTSIILDSATTNAAIPVQYLQANSTGTVANGFGVQQFFVSETATADTAQTQALISTSWIDATNATRKAKMSLSAYDTAARLGIEIEASGTEAKLGFYGVATITRAILATGAGATVDNVITALQNLGLVKQV